MIIKELKEEGITLEQINKELINNNSRYMITGVLIKMYNHKKEEYNLELKNFHVNQRLIDAAYKAAYNKRSDLIYNYISIDEIYDEFLSIYHKNQLLYYVMEEQYIKDRNIDGFIPYYNKSERRSRTLELIKYPLEYLLKGLFLNLVYDYYYDLYNDNYILENPSPLQDWNNDLIYESYFQDVDGVNSDSIYEFIINCWYEEYQELTYDTDYFIQSHKIIQYWKYRSINELVNTGSDYNMEEVPLQILELMEEF